jgi:FkbM family methyltransferase
MILKYFSFLFWSPFNYLFTNFLRPFSKIIPQKVKIPLKGKFNLRINNTNDITIHTNYTNSVGQDLFWGGFKGFEYEVTNVFVKIIPHCNTLLDIGANIGYYSLLAKKVNSNIYIHAFEPLPDCIHYFNLNIESNNFEDIKIHQIALSDKKGIAKFESRVSKDFPNEKYQLAADSSLVNYDNSQRKQITVETDTLDDYFQKLNINSLDYIKIDTETTEYTILKNSKVVLDKYKPIIQCEVLKGYNESELAELMLQLNYSFFLMT